MIQVSFRKKDGKLSGFSCVGHAGYAEEGSDIVCAGVSALVINAVNSLETLTEDQISYRESDGDVQCDVVTPISSAGELLLQSLQLGLSQIEEDCGSQFVHVTIVD